VNTSDERLIPAFAEIAAIKEFLWMMVRDIPESERKKYRGLIEAADRRRDVFVRTVSFPVSHTVYR